MQLQAESSSAPFKWDAAFLDEGHLVKSAQSKTCQQALHRLNSRTCIAITGTPIQNNLQELHALLALCCPDLQHEKHLGSAREFERNFSSSIKQLLHALQVSCPSVPGYPQAPIRQYLAGMGPEKQRCAYQLVSRLLLTKEKAELCRYI
jgi:hypothetical protein